VSVTYIQNFEFKCLVILVFFGILVFFRKAYHIWKKIPENTEKKRKKGALKSRISSLSIVTYPQGVTVFRTLILELFIMNVISAV